MQKQIFEPSINSIFTSNFKRENKYAKHVAYFLYDDMPYFDFNNLL